MRANAGAESGHPRLPVLTDPGPALHGVARGAFRALLRQVARTPRQRLTWLGPSRYMRRAIQTRTVLRCYGCFRTCRSTASYNNGMKLTSGDVRTRRWLRDGACESLEGPRAGNRAPSRANRASVSCRRSQLIPVFGGLRDVGRFGVAELCRPSSRTLL